MLNSPSRFLNLLLYSFSLMYFLQQGHPLFDFTSAIVAYLGHENMRYESYVKAHLYSASSGYLENKLIMENSSLFSQP